VDRAFDTSTLFIPWRVRASVNHIDITAIWSYATGVVEFHARQKFIMRFPFPFFFFRLHPRDIRGGTGFTCSFQEIIQARPRAASYKDAPGSAPWKFFQSSESRRSLISSDKRAIYILLSLMGGGKRGGGRGRAAWDLGRPVYLAREPIPLTPYFSRLESECVRH